MLHIGSVVVVPNVLRRFTLRKEEHVRLNPLRIEEAGRQAKDRVQIEIRQELLTDRRTFTFKQNIVRQHHTGTPSAFKHRHDVLNEIQLIVLRFDDEVRTIDLNRTGRTRTKRRICKDHP